MRFLLLLCFLFSQHTQAFVLLSGPEEAILPATPVSPTIVFEWDGSAPELEELESFQGGRFIGLSNEDAMEQILLIALDIWNAVPGSYLRLAMVKKTGIEASSEDNLNTIVVRKDSNLSSAAFAIPTMKDKIITDCDIRVSSRTVTAQSLAYTLVHELGHCIGLGHAHSNYGAIMGYSRTQRTLRLGADDMAGVIYLYTDPAYTTTKKDFLACAVVGQGHEPGNQTKFLWLLFLLLPIGAVFVIKSPYVIPRK